jgi:hypothetical protein
MSKTLPQGYIDIDTAVEQMARRENPNLTTVYRDEADAAWRTLCKLAPAAARIMTGDGLLRKPAPVQFDGFADRYWKFASILRGTWPGDDAPCELEVCPPGESRTHALLDERGQWHGDARLVFLESGIGTAPETSAPKPRARPQRDKAKRLLQNMFPNGMPPKDKLPPRALLAKCRGPEWDRMKRDSIGRAAKELREAAARK